MFAHKRTGKRNKKKCKHHLDKIISVFNFPHPKAAATAANQSDLSHYRSNELGSREREREITKESKRTCRLCVEIQTISQFLGKKRESERPKLDQQT